MRAALVENAQKLDKLKEEIKSLEEDIERLQEETFGSGSEEVEQKAREFFSDVGDTGNDPSVAQQIDDLREDKQKRMEVLEDVKSELLEQITDIRFPFNESIDVGDGVVRFPFEENLDSTVLDSIDSVLSDGLDGDGVHFGTDEIRVDTESVDDAIESVDRRVSSVRKTAETQMDADKHARELRERDTKIARMLYVLRDREPMQKRELEEAMGLESGALRGQLYHVLNKEPYLEKNNKKISLTSTGELVIEEYEKLYGEPELDSSDEVEGNQ